MIREVARVGAAGRCATRRPLAGPLIALSALLALTSLGCKKTVLSSENAAPGDSEALAAVLVAADRADGAEDKVVARCAVCGLGMDGSADFTATHAGYTFRFCSAECRELFQRDPDKALARLNLSSPAGPAAAP